MKWHRSTILNLRISWSAAAFFRFIIPVVFTLLRPTPVTVVLGPLAWRKVHYHFCDVIMGAMAPQITSRTIVYSTVYSGADKRNHQSSASLAFVRGIHRLPVNSPHKWPVTRKMFPFDDVIMSRFNDAHPWSHWAVAQLPGNHRSLHR